MPLDALQDVLARSSALDEADVDAPPALDLGGLPQQLAGLQAARTPLAALADAGDQLGAPALARLQGTAGNAAVGRLLARYTFAAPPGSIELPPVEAPAGGGAGGKGGAGGAPAAGGAGAAAAAPPAPAPAPATAVAPPAVAPPADAPQVDAGAEAAALQKDTEEANRELAEREAAEAAANGGGAAAGGAAGAAAAQGAAAGGAGAAGAAAATAATAGSAAANAAAVGGAAAESAAGTGGGAAAAPPTSAGGAGAGGAGAGGATTTAAGTGGAGAGAGPASAAAGTGGAGAGAAGAGGPGPAPASMGAAPASMGPAPAPSPEHSGGGGAGPVSEAAGGGGTGALDDRVRELLEASPDPEAQSAHDTTLISADTARLAALQYTYQPNTGFLGGLRRSVLPVEALSEHFNAIVTNNQYASSANGGEKVSWIAKVQAVIEGIRGVLRMVGDVVGAGATILSYVSMISGLVALIPPAAPIAGPIAAVTASAALTLTGVKVVIDLIDAAIGIVQGVLLAVRARMTEDPAERARIALMLRREAGEVTSSLVNAGVGWVTNKLGRMAEMKLPPQTVAANQATVSAAKAGFRNMGVAMARGYRAGGIRGAVMSLRRFGGHWSDMRAIANSIPGAGGLPRAFTLRNARFNEAVLRQHWMATADAARVSAAVAAAPGRLSGAAVWVGGKIRTSLVPKLPSMATKVPGQGLSFARNQGRRQRAVAGDQTPDVAGPQAEAEAPQADEGGQESATYQYWPSVIERYKTMRDDIGSAKERMQEQHEQAKEDAGASGTAVLAIKAAHGQSAGSLSAAGQTVQSGAQQDQAAAQNVQTQAQAGQQATQTADGRRDQAQSGGDQSKAEADRAAQTAVATARSSRPSGSIAGWLYDKTIGKVFKKIGEGFAWLQNKIASWLTEMFMGMAGIKPEELDLAGMQSQAEADQEQGQQAEQAGQGLTEDQQKHDQAMATLLEGASDSETNAVRGVSDTFDYLHDLSEWEMALTEQITTGESYMAAHAPLLGAQTGEQETGDVIDGAAIESVTSSGGALVEQAGTAPGRLEQGAPAAVQAAVDQIRAALEPYFVSVDLSDVLGSATQEVQGVVGGLTGICDQIKAQGQELMTSAGALVGTSDFAQLGNLANQMSMLMDDLAAAIEEANLMVESYLQDLVDAYQAAAAAAITAAGPRPPEGATQSEAPPETEPAAPEPMMSLPEPAPEPMSSEEPLVSQ